MAKFRIRRNTATIATIVGGADLDGLLATAMLAILTAVEGPVTIERYDEAKRRYVVLKPSA